MLSTPHLLVGAAIVRIIPNPVISLPLAFLSHYALDSVPHWDGSPKTPFSMKTTTWVVIDYLFGISLVYLLTAGLKDQYLIWLGAFLGTAPDFILGAYRHMTSVFSRYSLIRIPNEFHMSIQRNVPFWTGLVVSTVTSLLCILILLGGR